MTSQLKKYRKSHTKCKTGNASFAVYGFKNVCGISKMPVEISHTILNPYTTIYDELSHLRVMTFWVLVIRALDLSRRLFVYRCVYKRVVIGSGGGLPPIRRQHITRTNADLMSLAHLETNFCEVLMCEIMEVVYVGFFLFIYSNNKD